MPVPSRLPPNATVEELLKKLPGVEVGSDGSSKRPVARALRKYSWAGRSSSTTTLKIASKTCRQIWWRRCRWLTARTTWRGSPESMTERRTVINLTVKKDRQNGWFGNVKASYGTDEHYNPGRSSSTVSQNGNQFTLLGGLNNVNDMGFQTSGGRFMSSEGGSGRTAHKPSLQFRISMWASREVTHRRKRDVQLFRPRHTHTKTATQYLFPDSTSFFSGGSRSRTRGTISVPTSVCSGKSTATIRLISVRAFRSAHAGLKVWTRRSCVPATHCVRS